MGKRKIIWNSDRLLSITAMVMSFITLIIFVYQTNLMRKQNYLSILPYVQFSVLDDGETSSYGLSLKNHGVGPAIVESVILEYQGNRYNLKDYNNELHTFLAYIRPELDSIANFTYGSLDPGIAIPANSSYIILYLKESAEDYSLLKKGIEALLHNGLRYEIIYRSIQDERWMIHNNTEGPVKLE
jgi:hypothetical protein